MPRSPADITFLTIVAAFSATEYAEATTRMRRAGEAMLNAEKKQKANLNISREEKIESLLPNISNRYSLN